MGVSTGNCDVSCCRPGEGKKSDVAAPMGVSTGSCAVVGQEKARSAMWRHLSLVLNKGSSSDPSSKEEAWGYYTEAMDVIDNKSQGCYPEMEVLWLMTKAWNCGIHLLSAGHYVDAEHWCGMSMKLLKHLTSLRTHYDTQMTAVYGEVLAKIEAQKVRSNKEE
uniref:Uncharacterized protein n=1 Tax=Branchiostoma floridae TaxID=7739 RepID=C3YI56_BRAFL|eukprot:XP_002604182.1 hypothetical protein BRAFLDRAFT_120393 [Branchiostoma floridae]